MAQKKRPGHMLKRLSSMGFFLMGYFLKWLGIKRGKEQKQEDDVSEFEGFFGCTIQTRCELVEEDSHRALFGFFLTSTSLTSFEA